MRIAYLVLANERPSHLQKLAYALDDFDDHIFIHINKRSDTQPFTSLAQQQYISLIPNRIAVYWGGFSMLKAVLNLLYAARNSSKPFQYYCFISESDYPVRSNQEIHSYLDDHTGHEFIDIVDIFHEDKVHLLTRLEHFVFEIGLTRKANLDSFFFQINSKILKSKQFERNYQRHLGNLKPYIGGAWWVLSDQAVHYILNFIETHPRVVNFYRHTAHPLEMLIHTILGNSPFSDAVSHNVTYTHWVPRSNSPSFLTDDHIDDLEHRLLHTESVPGQKEFLFARKFPQDRPDLISRIDHNLRGIKMSMNY